MDSALFFRCAYFVEDDGENDIRHVTHFLTDLSTAFCAESADRRAKPDSTSERLVTGYIMASR